VISLIGNVRLLVIVTLSPAMLCALSSAVCRFFPRCDTSHRRDISTTVLSASLEVEDDDDLSWKGSSVEGGGEVLVEAVL